MAGGGAASPLPGQLKGSSLGGSAAPGVDFSEEKRDARGIGLAPLSVGEGIAAPDKSPPKPGTTTDKHLEKATSLLDELSREERSGYKAEIAGLKNNVDKIANEPSPDRSDKAPAPGKDDIGTKVEPVKRTTSQLEDGDNYDGDDFEEEIDEDLPEDDLGLDISGDRMQSMANKIEASHGITVSQSLGIDPSVDSLALEAYDLIEPVERTD